MVLDQVIDLFQLCYVPRWVVVPVDRQQSVADHSFRVAVIARYLSEDIDPPCDMGELLWWALIHDAPEGYTGDLPTPFKRKLGNTLKFIEGWTFPWYRQADKKTWCFYKDLVKLADSVEAYMFLRNSNNGWVSNKLMNSIETGITDFNKIYGFDLFTSVHILMSSDQVPSWQKEVDNEATPIESQDIMA